MGQGPLDRGDRVAALATWSGPLNLQDLLLGPAGFAAFRLADYVFGRPVSVPATHRAEVDAASPISHVSCDDPPSFVSNAIHELIPLAQAETFVDALKSDHVPYELVTPPSGHSITNAVRLEPPTLAFFDKWVLHAKTFAGFCSAPSASGSPSVLPSPPSSVRRRRGPVLLILVLLVVILVAVAFAVGARSRRVHRPYR